VPLLPARTRSPAPAWVKHIATTTLVFALATDSHSLWVRKSWLFDIETGSDADNIVIDATALTGDAGRVPRPHGDAAAVRVSGTPQTAQPPPSQIG
jgi:hypothetical protein